LQLQAEVAHSARSSKISELFDHWDHDASGTIDVNFTECALALYKQTPLEDAIAEGNCVMHCHSQQKHLFEIVSLFS